MSDLPKNPTEFGLAYDAAQIVNDSMHNLDVGSKPAIARDEGLLDHANELAERIVNTGPDRLDSKSIESDILLAEANQAELLSDYGVIRRQAFRRLLKSYMARVKKDPNLEKRGVVLIMSDGNGLKTINDTLNHAWGDQFVKMWADQLTKHMRQSEGDIFFQHGSGDELAAMIDFESEDVATRVMNDDGAEEEPGRITCIKRDILLAKQQLINGIDNFPQDNDKEIGTLAIGWNWISNRDLLDMFRVCNEDPEKMIAMMYQITEENMKIDKGRSER